MSREKGKSQSPSKLVSSANDAALKKTYSTEAAPAASQQKCAGGMCREHCNVTAIRVSDGIGARTVIADSPASPRLESGYDFLYEVTADYEGSETEKLKPTTVALEVPYAGRCPVKAHPDVTWYPLGSTNKACRELTMELVAPKVERNWGKTGWAVFASRGQEFQDYVVVAASCGIGSGSKVNATLRGLVRVYRTNKWDVTFELPPFRSWKYERKELRQAKASDGFKVEKTESDKFTAKRFGTSVAGGGYSTTRSHEGGTEFETSTGSSVVAPGVVVSSGRRSPLNAPSSASSFREIELPRGPTAIGIVESKKVTTSFDDATGQVDIETSSELSVKPTFKFTISRNGRELEVVEVVQSIVNAVMLIKRTMSDFIDLVPQVGLKVSFDVSLLEGSLTGTRERVLCPAAGRVARVDDKASFTVKLKFLAIKLEVSFGLAMKSEGVLDDLAQTELLAIEATIELIIEGSVEVSGTFSRRSDVVKGAGEIKPTLKLNGHATIIGYKYGIEGVLDGGLTAEATIDLNESPFRAAGKIERSALEAKLSAFCAGSKTTKLIDKTIFKAKPIWQGPIFGA